MQLITFLIILAITALILLIPLGIVADYNANGFKLLLKIAIFEVKPKFSKKKPKKNNKEFKLDFGIDEWTETARITLQTLGRLGKSVCFNRFRIVFVSSAADPYDAAMRYNYASAILHTIIPLFEQKFTVKNRSICLSTDFESEKSIFELGITMTVRVGHILMIAPVSTIAFIKVYLRSKRGKNTERKVSHG